MSQWFFCYRLKSSPVRTICLLLVLCLLLPTTYPVNAEGNAWQPTPGSSLVFGHYEQDNIASSSKEPITWRVLAVEGDRILVISELYLDCMPFNENKTESFVTWETCTLRTWLNNEFLNEAFTSSEQESIISSQLDNEENAGNTKDMVFLLSSDEAEKFFETQYGEWERLSQSTAYTKSKDPEVNDEGDEEWWLRSYSPENGFYGIVGRNGGVMGTSSASGKNVVRPAMWLSIEKMLTKQKLSLVGNIVMFGHYEQDNDLTNGSEPISWIVLAVEGDRLLLISEKNLDCMPYLPENQKIDEHINIFTLWGSSTPRAWLNSEFLNRSFSNEEQRDILLSTQINNYRISSDWSLYNTSDRIFLLSDVEETTYFSTDNLQFSMNTPYSQAQGANGIEEYKYSWLRSNLHTDENGNVHDGYGNKLLCLIRPAIYVDIESSLLGFTVELNSKTDEKPVIHSSPKLAGTWKGKTVYEENEAYIENVIIFREDGTGEVTFTLGEINGMSATSEAEKFTYTDREGKLLFLDSKGSPLNIIPPWYAWNEHPDRSLAYILTADTLTLMSETHTLLLSKMDQAPDQVSDAETPEQSPEIMRTFVSGPRTESLVHISDLADVLDAEEEAELEEQANEVFQLTGFDIVLHTTNDSQGKGPMDYSFDYYYAFRDVARYPDGALLAIMYDTRDYYEAAHGKGIELLTYRESYDLGDVVQAKLSDSDVYGAMKDYIQYIKSLLVLGNRIICPVQSLEFTKDKAKRDVPMIFLAAKEDPITISVSENAKDWISCSDYWIEKDDDTFYYTNPNGRITISVKKQVEGGKERDGYIVIRSKSGEERRIHIVQQGFETIEIRRYEAADNAAYSRINQISISELPLELVIFASNTWSVSEATIPSWLSITPAEGKKPNISGTRILLELASDHPPENASTALLFECFNASKQVVVNQVAPLKSVLLVTHERSRGDFVLPFNNYRVESTHDWLAVNQKGGQIQWEAQENSSPYTRSADIVIRSSQETVLRSFTIAQPGIGKDGQTDEMWLWPVDADRGIYVPFGAYYRGDEHGGIDISYKYALDVEASRSGIVTSVKTGGKPKGDANSITIKHETNGGIYYSYYLHLSAVEPFKVGDPVRQGDKIGMTGNTGDAEGIHLHFRISKDGVDENGKKIYTTTVDIMPADNYRMREELHGDNTSIAFPEGLDQVFSETGIDYKFKSDM